MPAYAQERRPCYRLGRTRRPRALVPGEEACGIRRSAKGARGDQRRHTCQCPALIAMLTGFTAAIPANCSFQLCSFRGSLVTTQAAEASRAAADVVRRRRKIDAPQLPPTRLGATVCGPCSASVPIPSRPPRACAELADQGVRAGGGVLCRARFAPAGSEPDGDAVLAAPELSRKQWLDPVGHPMSFLASKRCYSVPPFIL